MQKKIAYVAIMAAAILVTSAISIPNTTYLAEAQKGKDDGKAKSNYNSSNSSSKHAFMRKVSQTIVTPSESHNAEGHSSHQAVYFVYPREGKIYDGKLTFTSTKGVDVLVYHDVTGKGAASANVTAAVAGLAVHKIDGRSYVVTPLLKNVTSATVEFVGAGILAHTTTPEQYTVVATVNAVGLTDHGQRARN